MTEKQTYTSEPQLPSNAEAGSQEEIDVFNEWAASGAAQRIINEAPSQELFPVNPSDTPARQTHEQPQSQQDTQPQVNPVRRAAAITGTALAIGGLGYAAHEAFEAPEFSEETTTYTVEPGDGISAAAEQVKGISDWRDAAEHIQSDPANIDVLKDGLQAGEQLIIPVSVEGYKEDK